MENSEKTTNFWRTPIAIAFALAVIKIFLFLLAGNQYGYFRDELYFVSFDGVRLVGRRLVFAF